MKEFAHMRKVVVYVSAPEAHVVKDAIALSGAGRIGNYSATTNHSAAGYSDALQVVDEERIEFACDEATYADVITAINNASPLYAAVDSWSLDLLAL